MKINKYIFYKFFISLNGQKNIFYNSQKNRGIINWNLNCTKHDLEWGARDRVILQTESKSNH
jgi:hypothetical protein